MVRSHKSQKFTRNPQWYDPHSWFHQRFLGLDFEGSPGSCWEEKRVGTQGLWGTDEMVDETFWNRSGNYLKCIQMRETVVYCGTLYIKTIPLTKHLGFVAHHPRDICFPNKPLWGMVALDESHSSVWKFPPIKRLVIALYWNIESCVSWILWHISDRNAGLKWLRVLGRWISQIHRSRIPGQSAYWWCQSVASIQGSSVFSKTCTHPRNQT